MHTIIMPSRLRYMGANQTKQKNDLPDCWKQPVNVLLYFLIASSSLVLFLTWAPHTENLYPYAVALMGAIVTSLFLTVEWVIRSPSSPIFPPGFKFNNPLSKRFLAVIVAAGALLPFHNPLLKIILAALAAAAVALLLTTWIKPAAEVLVTRISFSNSPFIPLAPPRLRTV